MEQVEMNILGVIQNEPEVSQREISERVGLSLGMVNLLLKKFLKVGWIKAEKINGNKMKYLLTPNGISQLSTRTMDYISRSYKAVLKIRMQIRDLLIAEYTEGEEVIIVASENEIFDILVDVLREEQFRWVRLDTPPSGVRYLTWGRIIEDENGIDIFRIGKFTNINL